MSQVLSVTNMLVKGFINDSGEVEPEASDWRGEEVTFGTDPTKKIEVSDKKYFGASEEKGSLNQESFQKFIKNEYLRQLYQGKNSLNIDIDKILSFNQDSGKKLTLPTVELVNFNAFDSNLSAASNHLKMQPYNILNVKEMASFINVPVTHQQWSQQLSNQVLLVVNGQLNSAKIFVDPPELGPIEVSLSSKNDLWQVSFITHQQGIREYLEQSIAKLRETFSDNGLQLVDVNIQEKNQQSTQQKEEQSKNLKRNMEKNNQSGTVDSVNDENSIKLIDLEVTVIDYYV